MASFFQYIIHFFCLSIKYSKSPPKYTMKVYVCSLPSCSVHAIMWILAWEQMDATRFKGILLCSLNILFYRLEHNLLISSIIAYTRQPIILVKNIYFANVECNKCWSLSAYEGLKTNHYIHILLSAK